MTEENLDLSHINICIAYPSMSDQPEGIFKDSLEQTKKLLEACGATVHELKVKYCADVYVARSRILGAFYRLEPNFSHLFMVDDDMGWDSEDVIRMILQDRELIAAAGPKKQYPITFAFALHDDYGRPLPMAHEVETRIGEVSEIGGAFVLLKRSCVERMIQAYPELEYDGERGVTEYALYDPIIINKGKEWPRRRLSEDYAFCYRWRKLGGKVYVLLDVRLSHVGKHTFTASLFEHLVQLDPTIMNPPDERILTENESYT